MTPFAPQALCSELADYVVRRELGNWVARVGDSVRYLPEEEAGNPILRREISRYADVLTPLTA